jgi:hypothetical protein
MCAGLPFVRSSRALVPLDKNQTVTTLALI